MSVAASLLAHSVLVAVLLAATRSAQGQKAFLPPTGDAATIVDVETDAATARFAQPGNVMASHREPAGVAAVGPQASEVGAQEDKVPQPRGETPEDKPSQPRDKAPGSEASPPRDSAQEDKASQRRDEERSRSPASTMKEPSSTATGHAVSDARKAETGSTSEQDDQGGEGGVLGQKGLPPGVADLTKAFVKTLPLAAKSDARWLRLPEGPAGSITVRLELDDEGHLDDLIILDASHVPAHLKRLAEMNQRFLARGRFAIASTPSRATQVLVIHAIVERRPATKVDSDGVHALGMRGQERPTGAYFTYYSGRHVELAIEEVP